jgi:hypothetical protein
VVSLATVMRQAQFMGMARGTPFHTNREHYTFH